MTSGPPDSNEPVPDFPDPIEPGPAAFAHPAPEWPFPSWDRYEFRTFIGQGAMGQVFSVFDPVLNRTVAMKVLSERGMPYSHLFLEEARAQARVEHPNVAKVHEVGEEQGRPYIIMQLLNGQSLQTLCKKLRPEESVEILRQACEGIQAAHAFGLLHRDLKPANIVVSRDDEARWHAFVVDFGMACEGKGEPTVPLEEEDDWEATQQKIMGTPAFMSPEQAFGEPLDRRSDVYSLGSTLYFVLTGTLPFGGKSPLSTQGKVRLAHRGKQKLSRPDSPRKFNASIPKDLEAILLRAMAPSPQDRYPSAKALGQDLQRWLDGDPVEAMKKSALYRVKRWARKNRLLASSLLLFCLTLTGAGLWALSQRTKAQKQAYYYHYFAQEAELMDASLALAESYPLHDTLPERARIRQQMSHLERVMKEAGRVAEAPGLYALGRGHMTQAEWPEARKALERAWALGLQTPEVAFALGSTLSHLYSAALHGLFGQGYRDRKAQLDKTMKPAILSYLSKARQTSQRSTLIYVEALLAAEEGSGEDALAKADAVLKAQPWRVDALLLKAGIHIKMGTPDVSQDAPHLKEAKALLKKAQDLARSCARAYEMDAMVSNLQMQGAIKNRKAFGPYFEEVLAATAKARKAHSRSAKAIAQEAKSLLYTRDGTNDWYWRGKAEEMDLPGTLRRVIALADQALALQPDEELALNAKGVALWQLADLQLGSGENPFQNLEGAIQASLQGLKLQPERAGLLEDLATAYAIKGNAEVSYGKDPSASFNEALRYYHRAETLFPNSVLYSNIVFLHLDQAHYEFWQGRLPKEALGKALKASRQSLAFQATFDNRLHLARIHLFMAKYGAWHGQKDLESLRLALEEADKLLEKDPRDEPAMLLAAQGRLLNSFIGGDTKERDKARRLLKKLKAASTQDPNWRYLDTWLALEDYRSKPSWRGYLALERRIQVAKKSHTAEVELHFLGFEACRIGWQQKAPGARDEQWRERAESHLRMAKDMNPLAGPEADRLLKTIRQPHLQD